MESTGGSPSTGVAAGVKANSAVVLDITHIFDDAGVHRYVLGIQMDCVDRNYLRSDIRYLADSALLISHLIKMSNETVSDQLASLMEQKHVK